MTGLNSKTKNTGHDVHPGATEKTQTIKRMTKLKTIYRNVDVNEIYFSDIKNELMSHELQFITNHWNREFAFHNEPSSLLDIQPLSHILKFLNYQTDLQQSGEIINTILIARIKSFIVNKQSK